MPTDYNKYESQYQLLAQEAQAALRKLSEVAQELRQDVSEAENFGALPDFDKKNLHFMIKLYSIHLLQTKLTL